MDQDSIRTLSDPEWLFVQSEMHRTGAACSKHPRLRGIVDAIFWISANDTSWSALPSRFPPHSTCYSAFYRWRLAGIIQPIFQTLHAPLPPGQPPGVRKHLHVAADEAVESASWFPPVDDTR